MQWSIYSAIIAVWFLQGVTIHWPYWQGSKTQTFPKYSHLANLATTLEDRLPPGDEIVLLPDNEAVGNLYYYLQRTPPHFWIMYYPWFVTPETNAKWIETVDAEKPQTLLFFGKPTPLENNAPEILAYVLENYETIDSVTWENGTVQIMTRRER